MQQSQTTPEVPEYNQGILLRNDELTRSQNRVPKLYKIVSRCGGHDNEPFMIMALNITQALARYSAEYSFGQVYKIEEVDNVHVMLYNDPGLIKWATEGKPQEVRDREEDDDTVDPDDLDR